MYYEALQDLLLEDVEETGKEIGRGAYGVVCEVKVSGLLCAGKKLHHIIAEESVIREFVDECLCHSRQRHPNIVQLIGVYISPDSQLPVLVMEYLPTTLSKCLETQAGLSLQTKYSILLDVAKGLNYLHRKSPPVVHRDLHANNVLLTHTHTAKISDMGVSIVLGNSRRARSLTMVPGNYTMMPPETFKDNPKYDHKVDVFSYGCLILHVFTNKWPAPTDEIIRSKSEWEKRSTYVTMMGESHPMSPIARDCLEDDSLKRPNMDDLIHSVQASQSAMSIQEMDSTDHNERKRQKSLPAVLNVELETSSQPNVQISSSINKKRQLTKLPSIHSDFVEIAILKDTRVRPPLSPRLPHHSSNHYPSLTRYHSDPNLLTPVTSSPSIIRPNTPTPRPLVRSSKISDTEKPANVLHSCHHNVLSRVQSSPETPPPLPPRPKNGENRPSFSRRTKENVYVTLPTSGKYQYYNGLSHEQAESVLMNHHKQSNFLVRVNTDFNLYLSLYFDQRVFHIRIYKDADDLLSLEDMRNVMFHTLDDLVNYYKANPLYLKCGLVYLM